jgi:TonB family protein
MSLLPLLLESTIKVSLILLAALAATALLRRRSAAMRHWLLSAAIACAAITPMLALVVPSWHVRLDTSSLRNDPVASSQWSLPLPQGRSAASQERRIDPNADANAAPARSAISASSLLSLPGAIWLIGVAISLSILLVGLGRLAWLASRATRLRDGKWTEMADAISREYGLRRPVLLLQSHHPALLATWGVLRPKLLLPATVDDWTEQRMRVVLCHELAHVRRRDWPVQMTAELLRSIYWFNPLLWIACRRLRHESERASDDEVLSRGVEGSEYATHVVELARASRAHRRAAVSSPALAMARSSGLERRIRAMLNAHLNRTPITRSARLAVVVALASLTLPIAGLGAATPPPSAQMTASFSGSVLDTSGAPIPGAAIVVTNVESEASRTISSDQDGRFQFADLPAGVYVLETQARGFARLRDDQVELWAGQRMQRNITLQIGLVRETITIASVPSSHVFTNRAVSPKVKAFRDQTPVEGLQQPVKLVDAKPEYPESLRSAGIGETVILQGRIGVDGSLTDLQALSPTHPEFGEAALAAARQWRFVPTRLHGVTVETPISITVTFAADR